MTKVIPVSMAITVAISNFAIVESAWIPKIVKRTKFENASGDSSSKQGSQSASDSNNGATSSQAASTSPTSKDSTPTSKYSASLSNALSKSAATTSSASLVQSSSANSAIPVSSTHPSLTAFSSGTSSITSATSSQSVVADQDSSKSSGSSGAVGAVIAMGVIIVIGAIAYLLVRRRKAKQNRVKMVEKADPFTMGYGNHDPLPYKETDNTPMAHSTYSINETYTNEANSVSQSTTHIDFTGNTPSNSIAAAFSQPATTIYNVDPTPTASAFSQSSQVSTTTPVAFNGNSTPAVAPLPPPQNNNNNNSSKLYSVIATYIPTLSDELEIEMGDQIELIAEFDDGWCQGINLTKGSATGVFPRHCIDRVATPVNYIADVERTKRVSSIRIQ